MRFRRPLDEEPEVNLVPLIDVLLIVLIFLAISTTYSRFTELRLELPRADATKTEARPNEILVAVSSDGRFALDKTVLPNTDPGAVAAALGDAAQGRTNPTIVIHADAQTPHQAVVNVMEGARLAGLPRISFVTERKAAARK
jgi:biopolymer transport protein ExbD